MGNIQSEIQKAREAMNLNDYDRAREICIVALKESNAVTMERSVVKDRLDLLVTLSDICKNQERLFDNINYLRELTKGARSINDTEMLAKGLIRIGFVFNRMGKRDRAMDKFNEAEELTKNFKNQIQYGYVLAGKANIYWRSGENEKALELAKRVLEIGLENDEFILTAGGANVMSSVCFEMGDYEEALKVAMLSVETYRNSGNKSELARALNNQGEIYKRMQEYDKAIESYQEGLSVFDDGTAKRLGYLYTNMAECQARKGVMKDAKISLDKAIKFLEGSEDKYAVGCMWYVRGLLEDANDNTKKGEEWLLKAEGRMVELEVTYDLGIIRKELASLYTKSGQDEPAADMANKAIQALEKAGAKNLADEVRKMVS
ncbi:MAG: tetratricopeptide repeat protein [Thermoplasmata archaeon]|nr:tetratricopeptide repeat protein [Thermoplasmata archaeon]